MRIALFTDSYDQINGVSNTLRKVVSFARKQKHELDVFTYDTLRTSVEVDGSTRILRFRPACAVHYYSDMYWDAMTLRPAIAKVFRDRKYDLIHVASPGSMGLNGIHLAHRQQVPLIGSYHTAIPEYTRPRVARFAAKMGLGKLRLGERAERAMWLYMAWFYGRCKLVLAPSLAVKQQLAGHFRPPVEVFSRGIDTEQFSPRFGEEPPQLTVLYVGRLSVEKNLDMLVRLAKRRPSLRFVLVGDGPYKSFLRQQLPTAVFPGFLTGERLSREYASADIFLFPSHTDTFGNVVLEAMSSGLPVVVSDRMGPAEIVRHGETGFIASNEEQFVEHLDWLASNQKGRQAMGQRARKYAESRDWNSVLHQLFSQYDSVAQVRHRRADLQLAASIETARNSREALPNVSSSESL